MFTGIVESVGNIKAIEIEGDNHHFTISSNISKELKIDQSVSHNGVCLTVISQNNSEHVVTAHISKKHPDVNFGFFKRCFYTLNI